MKTTWLLPLAAVFVLVALCTAATARVWTDRQGRTTNGKFIRLENGKVVIQRDSGPLVVPLESLSEKDQQYVQAQVEGVAPNQGAGSGPDAAGKAVPPNPFEPDAERVWTDDLGQTMRAQFVRAENGQVVLRKGGREQSFPFHRFSQADQQYIRDLVGDDAKLEAPALPVGPTMPRGMPPMMPPSMPMFPSPRFSPPGSGLHDAMQAHREAFEEAARQRHEQAMRRMEEEQRREQERAQQRLQSPDIPWPGGGQAPAGGDPFPHVRPSTPDLRPPGLSGPSGPGPGVEQYEYKYCCKCKKRVPDSTKVGDRCPHCGVRFDYEEDSQGNVTNAMGFRVPRWWIGVGGIGGLVCVGLIVLRLMVVLARS